MNQSVAWLISITIFSYLSVTDKQLEIDNNSVTVSCFLVSCCFTVFVSKLHPWWMNGCFLSLHHSFSTAYQCIYYSPEHTAKAQEVLSTMSLLQPLITSLADQLLQAAQEHSSLGLRDALKNLCDKVRQPLPSVQGNGFISLNLDMLVVGGWSEYWYQRWCWYQTNTGAVGSILWFQFVLSVL